MYLDISARLHTVAVILVSSWSGLGFCYFLICTVLYRVTITRRRPYREASARNVTDFNSLQRNSQDFIAFFNTKKHCVSLHTALTVFQIIY
jgi:hypothetical protein